MYKVGDKFNNLRRGYGTLTIIDAVADRVYGLGDMPFIRHKYFLKGTTTGKAVWVTDDDITDWIERGVLSVCDIDSMEPLRWVKPLSLTTL